MQTSDGKAEKINKNMKEEKKGKNAEIYRVMLSDRKYGLTVTLLATRSIGIVMIIIIIFTIITTIIIIIIIILIIIWMIFIMIISTAKRCS